MQNVRVLHIKYILLVSSVDRILSCHTESLIIVYEFPINGVEVQLPKHLVNKAIIFGCVNYSNIAFSFLINVKNVQQRVYSSDRSENFLS